MLNIREISGIIDLLLARRCIISFHGKGQKRLLFLVHAGFGTNALDPILRIFFRQSLEAIVLRRGEYAKNVLAI